MKRYQFYIKNNYLYSLNIYVYFKFTFRHCTESQLNIYDMCKYEYASCTRAARALRTPPPIAHK